jgi:hypothetical protein
MGVRVGAGVGVVVVLIEPLPLVGGSGLAGSLSLASKTLVAGTLVATTGGAVMLVEILIGAREELGEGVGEGVMVVGVVTPVVTGIGVVELPVENGGNEGPKENEGPEADVRGFATMPKEKEPGKEKGGALVLLVLLVVVVVEGTVVVELAEEVTITPGKENGALEMGVDEGVELSGGNENGEVPEAVPAGRVGFSVGEEKGEVKVGVVVLMVAMVVGAEGGKFGVTKEGVVLGAVELDDGSDKEVEAPNGDLENTFEKESADGAVAMDVGGKVVEVELVARRLDSEGRGDGFIINL